MNGTRNPFTILALALLALALAGGPGLTARAAQGTEGSSASPATGAWSATGSMATARESHTATLLPDGRVLVAGGYHHDYLASAEVYDPVAGTWSATGSMATVRYLHTATLLPDGRVLVAGGYYMDNESGHDLASAEIYDPVSGTWSTTGSLATGRDSHTATLLPDGRVLVVGGYYYDGSDHYLASAEIYDPAAGTWSTTGALATGRCSHTATLLPDGRVLVVGGYYYEGSNHYLADAEVYDPHTGTWSTTGPLSTGRYDHTATLLPDGRVLVAGGYGSGGFLVSAEVYNPSSGTWSATGALAASRCLHTATLLPDGRVLVAGGYDGSFLASAEVYDPTAGTWSAAGALAAARDEHTATLLPDGRVLIVGGKYYAGSPISLASAEIYSPAAGTWSATGPLGAGRDAHTATLLPDGRVLVAGGVGDSGYLVSAEVYDPAAKTWSATGALNTARFHHTATLLSNGRVLVAGGFNGSGWLDGAEVYNPTTGAWSATGSLHTARHHHTATLLSDGRVLVAGGQNDSGPLTSAEVYDPRTGVWSVTGSLSTGRYQHTATLLPDGRVLVAGGSGSGGFLASAEVYDPVSGTWSATGGLAAARRQHTATLLPDGRVLVAGGWNGGCLASAEVYNPASGAWSATGSLATARDAHTATLLPDGRVLVAGGESYAGDFLTLASVEVYNPAAGTWSATGALAAARDSHTATLLPDGCLLVAGGESYAGDWYALASAELYNRGLGFQSAWRPTLTTATTPLFLGHRFQAGGSGFRGYGLSEASSGGIQSSATNYPLVQLRRLDSEQVRWLRPGAPFSATAFTSAAVTDFPQGPALATVFVNGIPSSSRVIVVVQPHSTHLPLVLRRSP